MVIENELGIPPNYQLKAFNSKNIFQRNWHRNKFYAIELYLQAIKELKPQVALDIGTGSGNFEYLFHERFKEIIGVDHNEEAVVFLNQELHRRSIYNVKTAVIDITDFDSVKRIPNGLDLVVICDVIEHVSQEHAENFLKYVRDKLNDFGKIVVITPNYRSSWLLIEHVLDLVTIVPKLDGAQHLAKYNQNSLQKLFKNQGYCNLFSTTINTLGFLSPVGFLSKFLTRVEFHSNFTYGNLLFSVFQKNIDEVSQIQLWNKIYADDHRNLYQNFFVKRVFDVGHRWLAIQNVDARNIIDFGAGFGYHIQFEKPDFKKTYYCIDKRQTMLDGIQGYPGIIKILSDGTRIDLPDSSIDSIVASHILEHVEHLDSVLEEFSRILKIDGQILVTLPCDPGAAWNFVTRFSPSRRRLKLLGLDYDVVMKNEHLNGFNNLVDILKKRFELKSERFIPFSLLKNYNANLIYCAKYKNLKKI